MYRPAKPLEELALDLVFESFGEDRYNRTAADYQRLSALVSNLQDVHFRVNKELANSEARAAGQLGGSWFLLKCIGQGVPPGNRFYELVSAREHIRGAGLYLGAIWVATRELVAGVRFKLTTSRL